MGLALTTRERALCAIILRQRSWGEPRGVLLAWGRIVDALGLDAVPSIESFEDFEVLDHSTAGECELAEDDKEELVKLMETHNTDGRLGILKVGVLRKLLA